MKLFSQVFGKLLRKGAFNGIHSPEEFQLVLERERARADRSGNKFSLVVFDFGNTDGGNGSSLSVEHLTRILFKRIRLTDTVGWFDDMSIGTVLPGTTGEGAWKFADDVHKKASAIASQFSYRVYTYPLEGAADKGASSDRVRPGEVPRQQNQLFLQGFLLKNPASSNKHAIPMFLGYPVEFQSSVKPVESAESLFVKRMSLCKRAIDIFGSILALLLLSPVMLVIAVAVKVTSPGPIIFRQERFGLLGKKFWFLKFRSMYINNDSSIHREYIETLIKKENKGDQGQNGNGVYKITDDPRITAVGKFLRKTSLDELLQFINVLKGEMSLVGPRPPIPYEFEKYDTWHRRRVFSIKPGITGLWQVKGRSRTTFDEMVRLDLEYIINWSLWLDFKILIRTPLAVLSAKGAY
jgi:lipopolysaccharide/colanic/teichoic acid biosynthesis glycosyltransferase